MRIRSSWKAFEFACHSASCAPPPVGHGGSDVAGKALTSRQTDTLNRIASDKRGWNTATQVEAAPLVKRGLIQRVDGKGKGMGNSPVWSATEAGHKVVGTHKPAVGTVTFRNQKYELIEDTGTHYRFRRGDSVMKVPHSMATSEIS